MFSKPSVLSTEHQELLAKFDCGVEELIGDGGIENYLASLKTIRLLGTGCAT